MHLLLDAILLLERRPQNKSAAFILTMLSEVDLTKNNHRLYTLPLCANFARQIMSVIVVMGKSTPVQTEHVILDHIARGVSCVCVHIVIGTPGTMTGSHCH